MLCSPMFATGLKKLIGCELKCIRWLKCGNNITVVLIARQKLLHESLTLTNSNKQSGSFESLGGPCRSRQQDHVSNKGPSEGWQQQTRAIALSTINIVGSSTISGAISSFIFYEFCPHSCSFQPPRYLTGALQQPVTSPVIPAANPARVSGQHRCNPDVNPAGLIPLPCERRGHLLLCRLFLS